MTDWSSTASSRLLAPRLPKAPIASYLEVSAANAGLLRELLQLARLAAGLVEPPPSQAPRMTDGCSAIVVERHRARQIKSLFDP